MAGGATRARVGGRAGERGERGAADGCRHECANRETRRPSVLTRPSGGGERRSTSRDETRLPVQRTSLRAGLDRPPVGGVTPSTRPAGSPWRLERAVSAGVSRSRPPRGYPAMPRSHADAPAASRARRRHGTPRSVDASGRRCGRRSASSRGFVATTVSMSKGDADAPRRFDPDDILAPLREKVERDMAGLAGKRRRGCAGAGRARREDGRGVRGRGWEKQGDGGVERAEGT